MSRRNVLRIRRRFPRRSRNICDKQCNIKFLVIASRSPTRSAIAVTLPPHRKAIGANSESRRWQVLGFVGGIGSERQANQCLIEARLPASHSWFVARTGQSGPRASGTKPGGLVEI